MVVEPSHQQTTQLFKAVIKPLKREPTFRCSVAGLARYPVPYHPQLLPLREIRSDERRYGSG